MSTDPRGRRLIYMSVASGYNATEPEQSFEETRIADYIKAYTATGQPPTPCPPEPADASARITLGLPPLFQPHTELDKAILTVSPLVSGAERQIARLPVTAPEMGEVFASITCSDEFAGYSFEELRYWAYTNNAAHLPEPNLGPYASEGFDAFQTISCAEENSRFSLEELRLAHLRAPSVVIPTP